MMTRKKFPQFGMLIVTVALYCEGLLATTHIAISWFDLN